MKSIASRSAVWYAISATATLAVLSVAGFYAMQNGLIRGLDLLNSSEFRRIETRLGPEYASLSSEAINERIRDTTDSASVLFYIDIHVQGVGTLFKSSNLHGNTIPDIRGQHEFNSVVPGIGELRSAEFLLPPFDVTIGTPLTPVRDVMRGYVEILVALVAVMLIISSAIGFAISHFALRPVRLIEATANRIRSDNLSERIALENLDDEVSNLARLLNQMFDRLESSFKQVQRFTAEASHELKTPLSLIRLQGERLMIEGGLSATQEDAVQAQLDEVARLNRIIEELLFISRAEAGAITLEKRAMIPSDFLNSFAQDARVLTEHQGLHYAQTQDGDDGTASFDAKWIRQVLLNLVSNAMNASPPGGTIQIESSVSGPFWRVAVEDDGSGVEATARTKIFDRFVRLARSDSQTDGGSGLGLAICRSIVELHAGRIWAESAGAARGLRVVFEIPRTDTSTSTSTDEALSGPETAQKPRRKPADVHTD